MTSEHVFFDGPDSFVTVRHLSIRGTNFEIGRHLGQLARERYGRLGEEFRGDPLFARARRTFVQHNYPIHWERTRGLAAAFGVDPHDDQYDLTGLPYHIDVTAPAPGCSVVYYPPSSTASGRGYLSRNYDFPIGSMAEALGVAPPGSGRALPPVMSEPYVMSWYPEDGGYASLAIHAMDLLSGTLDGMNSAGLVVSILADEEAMTQLGARLEAHPDLQRAVGLHELQVMRLLLDTCATADEAKIALLAIKQYYTFIPCHYIVADRAGHSFVYENSTGRNVQHVLDGRGRPQPITNHQLHRQDAAPRITAGALTLDNNSSWRYQSIEERLAAHRGPFTVEDIKATNACVNAFDLLAALRGDPGSRGVATGPEARTVWHGLYDQHAGTLDVSFYLGEEMRPDGTRAERRSAYLAFALEPAPAEPPTSPPGRSRIPAGDTRPGPR